MCIDLCIDPCIDMSVGMCLDMCIDMCMDACIGSRPSHEGSMNKDSSAVNPSSAVHHGDRGGAGFSNRGVSD